MMTPRDRRLTSEFELLKALRSPHCLFDFRCSNLSIAEAKEFLLAKMVYDVIWNALPEFLTPEEYEAQHPSVPPEKYLILYNCVGLVKTPEKRIVERNGGHLMEVVFGWGYPAEPPTFIWLSDIWHPNFKRPYICIEGHSFAIGLTLDQIVPEVGRMIQYQNYNIADPLNREAAEWASQNPQRFPIDDRDILDRRHRIESPSDEPLIALPGQGESPRQEPLIELFTAGNDEQNL